MLLETPNSASTLTIIFIKLSFAVIGLRRKNKVGLGTGGHEELKRSIRTQGNFSEYELSVVVLIACLELNSAPWGLVALPGVTLIIGGLVHVVGINTPPPDFSKGVLGMKFTMDTLITLITLTVLNLGWVLYKMVG